MIFGGDQTGESEMSPWMITAVLGGLGSPSSAVLTQSLACCIVVSRFCSEQDRNPNNNLERQSFLFTY